MFNKNDYEKNYLSEYAVKSNESRGRDFPLEPCPIRNEFQRDRDRILHCKSFRRLKYKTQVFLSPYGDHFRTRMTHTLEVSQISRTIARALRLNEDLVEAISLGHDLGHTPFGHAGEKRLNLCAGHFAHNEQSLRIVEKIEHGKGLNLTFEVRDGILNHRTGTNPSTLEGKIVQISDKIAYINHDIDDAIRGEIFSKQDLPKDCVEILGDSHGKRIETMVFDIVNNSYDKNQIIMSDEISFATKKLRKFLFEVLYAENLECNREERKAANLIEQLYAYYMDNLDKLPQDYKTIMERDGEKAAVLDFISSMTDRYAIHIYNDLFVPNAMK